MPKKKKYIEEEVIAKATELFWEKGYTATSLIDLTKYLGLGEGSFYAAFKSKRNLFNLCYEYYMNERIEQLEKVFSSSKSIKETLDYFLNNVINELLSDKKHKGCFMANTCAELGGQDLEIQKRLNEHHHQFEEKLLEYLNTKEWTYKIEKDAFINLFLTYVMGMKQQSKFDFNKNHYTVAIKELMKLLDS